MFYLYVRPLFICFEFFTLFFFFFSSRRRHTRFDCDWSSDVCSSDLYQTDDRGFIYDQAHNDYLQLAAEGGLLVGVPALLAKIGERRVGKECRSRWSPYH